MRKLNIAVLAILLLMILSACESGGEFYVKNQTSYPVYVSVDGSETKTIDGGKDFYFKIDTNTQNLFTGSVDKMVKVSIVGETFALENQDEGGFTDSTYINIKAGKKTSAFLKPNRASIKLVNLGDQPVYYAEIWKYNTLGHTRVTTISNIAAGDSVFTRVDGVSPGNSFSYRVTGVIGNQNGETLSFGDATTILSNDQQFRAVLYTPPSPAKQ